MTSAFIVDAARSPIGRRSGVLAGWHPADLAAQVLNLLLQRHEIDPVAVDDVIMGCVTQVGYQAGNVGRTAVLAAGWPESVPATTIDRQCGSSQQAIHFAAQGVIAGAYDVVIAAGVEVMSTTPMGSHIAPDVDVAGASVRARYAMRTTVGESGLVGQGVAAEWVAQHWALSREDLDTFAVESHRRAAAATGAGRFDDEIVPVFAKPGPEVLGAAVAADEGIRDSSIDRLAKLPSAFIDGGRITAGNSSQISDGAAAVIIVSESGLRRLGVEPLARIVGFDIVGVDPITMLTGPIPSTARLLDRKGLNIDDIDLFEINEAFAAVPLAWLKETKADSARVNVNGGAVALGHPLGCSGARLMTTLVHELARRGGRFGLQSMCEGGGMANSTLIEGV